MIKLNERAEKHLGQYIQQIRICLKDCTTVDVDEVEQNVKEHIENELKQANEPVSFDELEAVLQKLGRPEQWIPANEISWWTRVALRLRCGPEDWRLAYISFGLFVLSLLLKGFLPLLAVFLLSTINPFGGRLSISFILNLTWEGISGMGFLLTSFYVSRVLLAITESRENLSGQKWLIYPSLIVVYIPLMLFILCGLPSFLGGGLILTGLWWIVLGIVLSIRPKFIHTLFRPFGNWWTQKYALFLVLIGLLLSIVAVLYYLIFVAK